MLRCYNDTHTQRGDTRLNEFQIIFLLTTEVRGPASHVPVSAQSLIIRYRAIFLRDLVQAEMLSGSILFLRPQD